MIGINAHAATKVDDCGVYEIYGQFKKNDKTKSYELIVNEKSISEYRFQISDEQERTITPYIGHSIKVTASILKKAPEYVGELGPISKVRFSIPDPANLNGKGGFELMKKEKWN